MAAALPPGAWWQRANTGAWHGAAEPYGPHAGDAAIQAAQRGNLELRNVCFSYPMRPNMAGQCPRECTYHDDRACTLSKAIMQSSLEHQVTPLHLCLKKERITLLLSALPLLGTMHASEGG